MSYIEELKELAKLKDDGILTDEEFQEKKEEILSRSSQTEPVAKKTKSKLQSEKIQEEAPPKKKKGLIDRFFGGIEKDLEGMKKNVVDKFADDILSDPKAKKASESLKKQEEHLLDFVNQRYGEPEYEEGLNTKWYDNGQKDTEETYKDGKKDGLTTSWRENGTKNYEGTFKDGEVISYKNWNKDGSLGLVKE